MLLAVLASLQLMSQPQQALAQSNSVNNANSSHQSEPPASSLSSPANEPAKSSKSGRKRRRGRKRIGHPSRKGLRRLPPYAGSIKSSEAAPLVRSASDSDSPADSVAEGTAASAKGSTPPTQQVDATEVSAADLAPGPVIPRAKVQSSPIAGVSQNSDRSQASAGWGLHMGFRAGESLTRYKRIDSSTHEGAYLLGVLVGIEPRWWTDLWLFGRPIKGEENLLVNYTASHKPGLAELLQVRIDSLLLLGSENPKGSNLTPIAGLGLGWADGSLRSDSTTERFHDQAFLISAIAGLRWQAFPSTAIDFKVEPMFFTKGRLSNFTKLDGSLGLVFKF